MDYGIGDTSDDYSNYRHVDHLNPFEDRIPSNSHGLSAFGGQDTGITQDGSCPMGAEIILKRIVKKLFNQMNELQPNELDDEFIYQSTLTYTDYLDMLKQIQDNKGTMSCTNLNRIENLLSNLMSSATIKRPTQTSLFSNLLSNSGPGATSSHVFTAATSDFIGGTASIHLPIILFVVCLLAWFFSNFVNLKWWRSWPVSFVIVGFGQYCMHSMDKVKISQRQMEERCANPSFLARIASLVNYDYNNCQGLSNSASTPNIAMTAIDYISQLVLQPVVHMGEKLGKSLEKYFGQFKGYNYYIYAPLMLVILIVAFVYFLYLLLRVWFHNQRRNNHSRGERGSSPQKALHSPKKYKINANHGAKSIK